MIKSINEKSKIIYFTNSIEDEDVKTVAKVVKKLGNINVSFDVNGRTKHEILGSELINKVKEKINVKGFTDYSSYGVKIELEKTFKAVYQFTGRQGIKYYKDQFCNWYGVIDDEINFCCHCEKGQPTDEKLEFDREVFDVELIEP